MNNDPYWELIEKQWEGIQKIYNMSAHLGAVLEYDIHAGQINAYPYTEYRDNVACIDSQKNIAIEYEQAQANNKLVLFIRDTKKEKLYSYTLERDETILPDPSQVTWVPLNDNKTRKKNKKKNKKKGKKKRR